MRLFHQVFLIVAASAMLAGAAMAGALTFSLRYGFEHYLFARDSGQLDGYVAEAELQLASLPPGQPNTPGVRAALVAAMRARGLQPLPPLNGPRQPFRGRDGQLRLPPPPEMFEARIALYDGDGARFLGPPPPPDDWARARVQRRDLHAGGRIMARVELLPRAPSASTSDTAFLRDQMSAVIWLGAAQLVLAALAAWLIARRTSGRLASIQSATQAIAGGDFATRIPQERSATEIADTVRNVNQMAEELERLEGQRRRWLAEISHELRTPLAVLRGEIDVLQDGLRPLNAAALLSLGEEVMRLSRITDDLHFLAVSDLDRLRGQFDSHDAVALCRTTVERFRQSSLAKGLEIDFVSAEASCRVWWEADKIDRMLAGLISNSISYTQAPGRIAITLQQDRDSVLITVEDSAPGVDAVHLPLLFDPLYRVEAARDRESGGSGLGLAIVAAIATAHGGSGRAEASALGGLMVTVMLPKDLR